MGIYKTLSDNYTAKHPGLIPIWWKAAFSLTAGGVGSLFGNPADLALIRMQADNTLPEAQRRNYNGVVNALTRIVREEGVLSLWKGATPTVFRAMAINLGMLGPYDEFKELFTKLNGGPSQAVNIGSSFCAASLACVITLPFDNVKTKFQRMAPRPDGTLQYSGFLDCFG
jgi:solute carrier family 25 oxoglutarate transporter 11